MLDQACGGTGSLQIAGRPARMMPAFSKPICSRVVAEIVGVVDVDAGDDGAVGIDDVDRIEAPAEADFEHSASSGRLRQQPHDRQRGEFE